MRYIPAILLLAAAVSLPLVSHADFIADKGMRIPADPRFIHSMFTADGQTRMLVTDIDLDTEIRKFTILDYEFNTVGTVETPQYPATEAVSQVSKAVEGPLEVYCYDTTWTPIDIGVDLTGMEFRDVLLLFREQGFSISLMELYPEKEEMWFFGTRNKADYYYGDLIGYDYPTLYRAWNTETNQVYLCTAEYASHGWGPLGKFEPPVERKETVTPVPVPLVPRSESADGMATQVITQTLFNTDAAYEWIIPVYTTVSVRYGNDYEQVSGKVVRRSGFRVVSETGDEIATVRYPSGYYGPADASGYELLMMGDRYYLMAPVTNADGSEEYEIAYEVTRNESGLAMTGVPMRVKVYPTAPRQGTPVEVELGETSGERCSVSVVSMTGRTVMTTSVQGGTTHTAIDTSAMPQGVYIVTVTDARGTRDATKIVVR